jgi:hypothetical protein
MTEPGTPGPTDRPRLRERRAAVRRTRRRFRIQLMILAVYLALSFLPFRAAWDHHPSDWLQSGGGGDIGQSAFFLAQFPYALAHHLNPFANTWTNWPYGANYMNNTSVSLLAVLMIPITVWASPILSLNVLFVLTVWLDCAVMFLVVLKFTRSLVASFFAGLIYGFSPMVTAAELGHVHVMFDVLPPVLFLLLYRLCVGEGRPVRNGVLLGLALAAQLYVFPEPLAACLIIAVIGLLVAAVAYRRRVRERLGDLVRGGAAAAGVFVVVAGVGLYEMVAGAHHTSGPLHPTKVFADLSSDLLSPVLPSSSQRYTLGMARSGTRLVGPVIAGIIHPDGAENGSYIGIPLLVVLVLGVVLLYRRHLVRMAAFLAVVSFVFSLGGRLRINGHVTPVRLPFDVLLHLPVVNSLIASRFAMEEWFFLALLLGVELAAAGRWAGSRRPWVRSQVGGRAVSAVVIVVLAAVSLAPLTPRWHIGERRVPLPTLAVGQQLRTLRAGEVVLGYPFPTGNTYLMLWQAQDRMRFRIVGAQLIQAGPTGRNEGSSAPPSVVQSILKLAYKGYADHTRPLPPVTGAELRQAAQELVSWRVGAVLWTDLGLYPQYAKDFLTRLLGPPSVRAADSQLWLDPDARLAAAYSVRPAGS